MMRVLEKLAEIKSDEVLEESPTPTVTEISSNHSPVALQPRSIPSLIPRLQLDQMTTMLPGFHQFRGFK